MFGILLKLFISYVHLPIELLLDFNVPVANAYIMADFVKLFVRSFGHINGTVNIAINEFTMYLVNVFPSI